MAGRNSPLPSSAAPSSATPCPAPDPRLAVSWPSYGSRIPSWSKTWKSPCNSKNRNDASAMPLTAHFAPLFEVQADWLFVGAWEEEAFSGALAQLDAHLDGSLTRLQQAGDITGKSNELITVLGRSGAAAERLLVVGLGKRAA